MRYFIGLSLVFVGVGLAAAFGSQLAPSFRSQHLISGELALAEGNVSVAHQAYCAGREAAKMEPLEGCGETDPLSGVAQELSKIDEGDSLSPYEKRHRELNLLKTVILESNGEVAGLRGEWLEKLASTLPLLKRQARQKREIEEKERESPGAEPFNRLDGWGTQSLPGFCGGLFLLIAGSLVIRVDTQIRTKSDGSKVLQQGDTGPQDFGVLLSNVVEAVRELSNEMSACEQPTEGQLHSVKSRLEDVQRHQVGRLAEAGSRLQAKYGLAGFAKVFSPFSAGERSLNRTWSTLVDRHWPEAQASIQNAAAQLEEANRALESIRRPAA